MLALIGGLTRASPRSDIGGWSAVQHVGQLETHASLRAQRDGVVADPASRECLGESHEAVQMVIETGRTTAEVARDLGMHDGRLGNWVNAWRRRQPRP